MTPEIAPCTNCLARKDNKWERINNFQKQLEAELEDTERALSVIKDRLAQLPAQKSKGRSELSAQALFDDDEEMSRAEMASYMTGMLEQWQREDAELYR